VMKIRRLQPTRKDKKPIKGLSFYRIGNVNWNNKCFGKEKAKEEESEKGKTYCKTKYKL
jgi:hypothetical protein